ncbi:MFS transporter [Streptomyces sp. SID13666]|uniref:MFS transporter n=1 Tax=unclassified Streptomyces TaxID=2593676 RepID=UPI0013C103AE|nr:MULTISPECIES: MFS transporter [unclassified Streptomyces]NEA55991.1 MFS transporter [Streptomyces sp. SID13666]NEA72028.1 MFS transporter [Streptomyces sp. SID13588]
MAAPSGRTDEETDSPSKSRFVVFFGGQVFSLLGDGLAFLAFPLVVLGLTRSAFAAALAAAPRTIGYLMVGLIAGAIVDRFNPRVIMIMMDAIRFSVFLTLALLARAGDLQVWVVLVLAFLASGAGVFFDTALTVAVRDLAQGERLVRANSWLEATNQASLAVGPGLFGVLTAAVGLHTALFGNAATYLLSLVTIYAVSGRSALRGAARPRTLGSALKSLRRDVAEGLRYLRNSRLILLLTCSQASANLFIAVETLIPFYACNILGLGAPEVGVVVGCGGVGGIAGAVLASRLATPARQLWLVFLSTVSLGMALGAIGLTASVVPLAALNLVVCACAVLAVVVIRTIRQQTVPRELLGRVTATARMTALAASPVGAMLAGLLTGLHHGDPRPVFIGSGLLAVTTAVVVWFAGLRGHARADRQDSGAPVDRHVRERAEAR